MLKKEIFDFLKKLKENNNREWFNDHKEGYNQINQEFHLFVNLLISKIKQFDDALGMLEAKDCTFRIYRDIRFSHDKTPYKTHLGAYMVPGGKKSVKAGYYFHLEPGNSFLAGGLWRPPAEVLKNLRQDIYDQPEAFKEILNSECFKKHFGSIHDDEKLKRPPKGFPADFEDVELLKHKNYTIMKKIPDGMVLSDDLEDEAMDVYRCMYDFNNFLNRSINMM